MGLRGFESMLGMFTNIHLHTHNKNAVQPFKVHSSKSFELICHYCLSRLRTPKPSQAPGPTLLQTAPQAFHSTSTHQTGKTHISCHTFPYLPVYIRLLFLSILDA